ncbi:MAG: class I SAM-dependent methyltransferase [Thermodesulfovibrio sp.]|nr:class I SAM-dependent methyltransferase [Thermodesulfovibrio sp.]
MMELKDKIKRDLEIIALEREEIDYAVSKNKETESSISFKEKIKKIPVLGAVAWYFYNLIISPFKIRKLISEKEQITEDVKRIREDMSEIKKMFEFIKKDLSFRYIKPEDYKIINIAGFLGENIKQKKKDFYTLFEESFRSKDIEIKLRKYLPFLDESIKNTGVKGLFIDVGCGRGEFLKILKELNLSVKGIEINREYFELLQKEGFDVHYGDGVEYLKGIEDDTLLGVSAIHVIEHLDFEKLKEFIEISYRKIKPEGLLIIETPNPKCSVALANFYIDFSHVRPCPYELISFLFENAGFRDIKLVMSSPVDRAFRTGNPLGDYMDYAIIGYKRRY